MNPLRKEDLAVMEREETGNEGCKRSPGVAYERRGGKGSGLIGVLRELQQAGQGRGEEPHYWNDTFASSPREELQMRPRNCQSGRDLWCLQSSTQLPVEAKFGCLSSLRQFPSSRKSVIC